MLSEEKIKKMIRLSDYENGIGEEDLWRTRYKKSDYIMLQILRTVASVFFAGLLGAVLFFLYHMNEIMYRMSDFPWKACLYTGGSVWFVFLMTGMAWTFVRSSVRYNESEIRVREYNVTLHELLELYEKEESGQEEDQP